ncbi:MAG TPA: FHA domain-containing protein [Lysobacter sp.]
MQARLIAYVPEGAAIARIVAPGERLRIGRAIGSDLQLPQASVSRRHAELEHQADGTWRLADLDSKNGTFVDGARIADTVLARSAWLRFGDLHCEFGVLDAQAAEDQACRWQQRRDDAARMVERIGASAGAQVGPRATTRLLEQCLRGVLDLAQCTRGIVLTVQDGRYRVATSMALDASLATGPEFTGSLGAVAQALRSRTPVVFNDVGQPAWITGRDANARSGLRTLVALPLLAGERIVGAIYADRRDAGPPLTTFDLELLQAFAQRCALWLAVRGEPDDGAAPPTSGDWSRLLADHAAAR